MYSDALCLVFKFRNNGDKILIIIEQIAQERNVQRYKYVQGIIFNIVLNFNFDLFFRF